ncbi:unnamed protein product [Effrenium voratum]|uniref:Uncharacterized protein n=1 Tax=Effrenium voratum TaxID=2562239 RepID=A0AA36HMM0_9DINO|nr:unnamed protein product [Effrenium voratum]
MSHSAPRLFSEDEFLADRSRLRASMHEVQNLEHGQVERINSHLKDATSKVTEEVTKEVLKHIEAERVARNHAMAQLEGEMRRRLEQQDAHLERSLKDMQRDLDAQAELRRAQQEAALWELRTFSRQEPDISKPTLPDLRVELEALRAQLAEERTLRCGGLAEVNRLVEDMAKDRRLASLEVSDACSTRSPQSTSSLAEKSDAKQGELPAEVLRLLSAELRADVLKEVMFRCSSVEARCGHVEAKLHKSLARLEEFEARVLTRACGSAQATVPEEGREFVAATLKDSLEKVVSAVNETLLLSQHEGLRGQCAPEVQKTCPASDRKVAFAPRGASPPTRSVRDGRAPLTPQVQCRQLRPSAMGCSPLQRSASAKVLPGSAAGFGTFRTQPIPGYTLH